MIRQPISRLTRLALGITAIVLILLAYSWLSNKSHRINPKNTTLPNATQFLAGWQKLSGQTNQPGSLSERWQGFRDSWLWEDFCATYWRLFAGISCGVVLSVIVGIAMGCLTPVEAFFLPSLSFFAKIPPTAMLAVYYVMFGTGPQFFVAMIALGIFPTLAQGIHQAAKKDVTDHAIYKAYTLGASHLEVIWNVVFQQILPRVIENVRLQVGPAMVFLIAAEMVVADVGFGYRLRLQLRLLNMNVAYIYLVILGASGFLIDWCLSQMRQRLSPWFGE